MKKLKILTVVGTRPEIIRLSKVIKKLDKHTNNIFVHTGQNYDYELNGIFYRELGLKLPHYQLSDPKKGPTNSISNILIEIEKIILKENPDGFLILGDTNSCLSAYVAKRFKIPIFHIEAGNRSYDQKVPEEINRKIIDHISDINITYSKRAKENLIRENIDPDKIFHVGSPLYEIYYSNKKQINSSKILNKLKLKKKKYYLLSVHREENVEDGKNFTKLLELLKYLEKKNTDILFSTHPRTMEKIKKLGKNRFKRIIFHKPFSYIEYSNLQLHSKLVLSDSGSITEESSIMGFDAINLRSTNERQEGIEYGVVPMTHFDIDKIDMIISFLDVTNTKKNLINDYKCINFSSIILNIIISYINYVNYYTWKKNI